MKKIFGFLLLIVGIFMLFSGFDFNFTGNLIQDYFSGGINFLQILGFVFLIGSVFLLVEKKGLDYLVIPTGWEEPRINKAKEELNKHHFDKVIITGHVDKNEFKDRWSHRQKIYRAMRKYGLDKEEIKIVDGIDSEEDILDFGKFLKKGDTVYFDTFPLHCREYKTLINKAIRDGVFPKGVKIKNAKIHQGPKEIVYGVAGWMEELLKRRKLDYKENRKEEGLDKIKDIAKKYLRPKS